MNDLLKKHPLPWSVHPDYPRDSFTPLDDEVVLDASGEIVLGCSEWLVATDGAVELMVDKKEPKV